jgi:hypothetical protein
LKERLNLKSFLFGIASVMFLFLLVAAAIAILSYTYSSSPNVNSNQTPPPPKSLPEFPWPPRASAFTKIPSPYLIGHNGTARLKDAAARLEEALKQGGYDQIGYYAVPGGFALVTRLEQFKSDGAPADQPYRWSQQVENPRVFSIDYLLTLLKGKVGHYRVIVFVFTNDYFSQESGKRVDVGRAANLAIEGANTLPDSVGNLPFTDEYSCTALIYEFEKTAPDQPTQFKNNCTLLAETHLQKILPSLEKQK